MCKGGAAVLLGQVLEEVKELYSSGWAWLGLWLPHTVLVCGSFTVVKSREE